MTSFRFVVEAPDDGSYATIRPPLGCTGTIRVEAMTRGDWTWLHATLQHDAGACPVHEACAADDNASEGYAALLGGAA